VKKCVGWTVAVCLGMTLMWFVRASGDYAVDLPNGYMLWSPNASDVSIHRRRQDFRSDGPHVPPQIAELGDSDGIVYGFVERSSDENMHEPNSVGYFVLNTRAHEVWLGMYKTEWLKVLRDNGILQEPTLVKPSHSYRCKVD
jgi:hypothetical protein